MTDAELEAGFQVAYCLHPHEEVAEYITAEAWRVSERYPKKLKERWTERLRQWHKRHPQATPAVVPATSSIKRTLPADCRFQYAVYSVSDRWEQKQEQGQQRPPRYTPTLEDSLVRYIKFLIWKTTDQARWHYVVGGLGCLLYTYSPQEIGAAASYFWDESIDVQRIIQGYGFRVMVNGESTTRRAEGIPGWVKKRFQSTGLVLDGTGMPDLRAPYDHERQLVEQACTRFTPWGSPHVAAPPQAPAQDDPPGAWDIWYQARLAWAQAWSDWQRVHVLIHPACGGIPGLIHTYNAEAARMSSNQLPDPQDKLRVPQFHPPSASPNAGAPDRFAPAFTPAHASRIKTYYERLQRRLMASRLQLLRVYIDGEERMSFAPARGAGVPFSMPREVSCIEVTGEDAEGEIPLSLFFLADVPHDEPVCQRGVYLEGGQTLTLQVSSVVEAETGAVTAYRLEVTYQEALRQRLLAWLWRVWTFVHDAAVAVRRPVPLLTCGVLLSLTLHAYRMLAPSPWPAEVPRARAPRQAVEQTEPTLHALTQQGRQAERAGNPTAAMAAYREALNQVAFPLNQLAWLLYQQGRQAERAGNPTAAMAAYREGVPLARLAVEWRPEKANYLDTLAVLLCQVGEQAEAVRWMEKAAAIEPRTFGEKLEQFRRGGCP
jgi:hypothetical protein